MIRLVAPVGHSRMNLLAAVRRIQPTQLLIISSKQTRQLEEEAIRIASKNSDLIIEQIILGDAHDLANMVSTLRAYKASDNSEFEDVVLISGSTNPIAMTVYLLWGSQTISLPPPGLQTDYQGEIIDHEITMDDVLLLQGLDVKDGKVIIDSVDYFSEATNCQISKAKGRIEVFWNTPELEDEGDDRIIKQFLFKVIGLGLSMATQFGVQTFHHFITGPPRYEGRIPAIGPFTYIFEGGDAV